MNWLLVGCGGFVGALARYGVGLLVARTATASALPPATLAVNVLGSFAAGALAARVAASPGEERAVELFLLVGAMGSFTTFSAFSLDNLALLRADRPGAALLNAVLHVGLALGAAWAGWRVLRAA